MSYIIDWQAWATLGTGILAVGGAVFVGLRQADIQGRQVTIQNRLAGIEELKLRQALFEDRIEVYDATREFLAQIVTHAAVPGLSKNDNVEVRDADMRLQQAFIEAIDRSRFLFRPSVSATLTDLWKTAVQINFHQKMQGDRFGAEDHGKHVDGEFRELKKVQAAHADLAAIFGDELTLSAHGATFAPKPTADETQ
ncbi:hypothetical protein MMB232_00772 [Brevundimonas subvibrioides]|uniref:hypothetical protein n=1 Tax=Brevundimonas subvibrioides TaxID=74313 RepID=UPI0032D589F5